ncbi:Moenomycin biosynthesis protein MoeGT1 [Streptomyces sp. IMTB 2501]|uniref:Moenomycin biosynthesis protein MoeGT1 n=1 Tax=Streptomyces sp. IMTB 2501 TaxID=1776340 RepID=UPI00096D8C31|nr:Moenomycin biosynthesis protein MoeGT1 [Streptomyces sp. IMTB 2501]OLZ73457.1 Moenomycin biosynthesis protein MoeGT1 [Streptomyces sp. IMTB 2501]
MRSDRPQIQVLSPRTWGEFGNYLAATRFSRVLRGEVDADVTLLEAEPILPWLGEAGAEIRAISLTSPDAATRTRRYMALMARLQERFPSGFEADPTPAQIAEIAPLTDHLSAAAPDVVVGTKGFVARLSVAAVRLAGLRTRVVSHVTNPGLLRLPLHRSPYPDLTLVGFDRAKEHLLAETGAEPDRVHVVGPLVAQHDLRDFMTDPSAAPAPGPWGDGDRERPRLIVFCNRGGDTYLELLQRIAAHHPDTDLVFVGYDDPDLARRAAAGAARLAHWRFHSRLTQAEYFDYIDRAARSPYGLLVSKAGPNTTLEAAYFGIPVLMLESGLPMEQWVPGLIHEHDLGRACATPEELFRTVDDWLTRPSAIEAHKKAAIGFAESVLDQEAVARRIAAAVRPLLEQP